MERQAFHIKKHKKEQKWTHHAEPAAQSMVVEETAERSWVLESGSRGAQWFHVPGSGSMEQVLSSNSTDPNPTPLQKQRRKEKKVRIKHVNSRVMTCAQLCFFFRCTMTSADVFIIAHLMLCVHKHAKYTQASSHLRQAKPAKIQDCTESIILQKC